MSNIDISNNEELNNPNINPNTNTNTNDINLLNEEIEPELIIDDAPELIIVDEMSSFEYIYNESRVEIKIESESKTIYERDDFNKELLKIGLKAYILISEPKNYGKTGLNVINNLFFNKVLNVIKNENQLSYFNYIISDYNAFLDENQFKTKPTKLKYRKKIKSSLVINNSISNNKDNKNKVNHLENKIDKIDKINIDYLDKILENNTENYNDILFNL